MDKDLTVDDHCHCVEESPSDHFEMFGMMGLAMAFSIPMIVHSQHQSLFEEESLESETGQMEEIKQKAEIIMTLFDGMGYKASGTLERQR